MKKEKKVMRLWWRGGETSKETEKPPRFHEPSASARKANGGLRLFEYGHSQSHDVCEHTGSAYAPRVSAYNL